MLLEVQILPGCLRSGTRYYHAAPPTARSSCAKEPAAGDHIGKANITQYTAHVAHKVRIDSFPGRAQSPRLRATLEPKTRQGGRRACGQPWNPKPRQGAGAAPAGHTRAAEVGGLPRAVFAHLGGHDDPVARQAAQPAPQQLRAIAGAGKG